MKKKKRTSKKTNFATKKLIRKKKTAFIRKSKKNARLMIALGIKPRTRHKRQQLAVPNLCPFKKDLIQKALRNRQELREELEQQKKERKERKVKLTAAVENCKKDLLSGLTVPKSYQNTTWGESTLRLPKSPWEHRHLYYKELNQVITNSDIIIEVLDARDPEGCRSKLLEQKIISQSSHTFTGNKKLILLLNKIDLIPGAILSRWMSLLKREFPVIAFKASTQSNKRKLHSNMKFSNVTTDKQRNNAVTNRCVGGDVLFNLLKQYSLSLNVTTPLTVGLIGYPNTGKSSVINSLKRQQSVGTSSQAGFTKTLQEVKLDKMMKLIDSPGVILKDDEVETRLVLRNALKLQDIDPIETVAHILSVAKHGSLAKVYGIEMKRKRFAGYEEWLSALAEKLGHVRKGGVPDLRRAAGLMIQDWNSGKIPFYVAPPEVGGGVDEDVKFVSGFAKEFEVGKLKELMEVNEREVKEVCGKGVEVGGVDEKYLELNADKFVVDDSAAEEDDEDEEDWEGEEDDDMQVDNAIDEEIMGTHAFMNA